MQDIITSYLIQKKECGLPLIGSFVIKSGHAINDIANKQILSPSSEIIFSETGDYLPDGLITYYSHLQRIDENEAEQALQQWCLQRKLLLDEGKKINFNSVGSLQKENGRIVFHKEDNLIQFFEPAVARRVSHKNDEHSILVGDRETTSTVMSEFYNAGSSMQKQFSWKIAALILLIISLLMLAFYFYDHSFSENTIGRQSSFPVADPSPSYKLP